ncbi:hypothetical protein BJX64DRAFT_263500, partial [Aspergillus heterothallicus]
MNNEQFRRLLFDNSQPSSKPSRTSPTDNSPPNSQNYASRTGSTPGGPGAHALGSRMRSSIPMTPRTLTKPDFARQLAEYRRDEQNPPPSKKFRSSAAPKGTRLPAGYQDRAARLREVEGGTEDKDKADGAGEGSASGLSAEAAQKLKILETRFKKGVIDEATFLQRRRELGVGGDLGSTHMVKGLDWDLLRKVRAGEDVEKREKKEEDTKAAREGEGEDKDAEEEEGRELDVDQEFDKVLEGNEDAALPSAPRERGKKKGTMAPPPAPASTGRKTRDEILRELKASRAAAAAEAAAAAAAAEENALGARFKRIGDSKMEKKRFIEQDENGRRREVLLITDAEGKTKRKTRWLDKPGQTAPAAVFAALDKEAKPLGMEVPAEIAAKTAKAKAMQEAEEEDDDIFAGVGADYNPLGDAGSAEDSDESEEEGEVATKALTIQKAITAESAGETAKPRNYFAKTATQEEKVESDRVNPLAKDPVLLAALKRAASLRQASGEDAAIEGEDEDVDKDILLRRKKFLEEARRREELDAMDMDYGFGGSRGADDEDDEEVILQDTRGGTKRKRGPKKKKGDKDSASDVLSVLEGRKKM